jgi:hypothetical protein
MVSNMLTPFLNRVSGNRVALVHYSYNDNRTSPLFTFADTQTPSNLVGLINNFNLQYYTGYSDLDLYVVLLLFEKL